MWGARQDGNCRETWLVGQVHPGYPHISKRQANGLLVPQMGGQGKERKFYRCSKCPKVRRQLTLVDAIVLSCHKVATSKATCFSIKCFWCSILCPEAYENQVHGGFLWYSNKKVGFPQCKYEKESSLLLSTT